MSRHLNYVVSCSGMPRNEKKEREHDKRDDICEMSLPKTQNPKDARWKAHAAKTDICTPALKTRARGIAHIANGQRREGDLINHRSLYTSVLWCLTGCSALRERLEQIGSIETEYSQLNIFCFYFLSFSQNAQKEGNTDWPIAVLHRLLKNTQVRSNGGTKHAFRPQCDSSSARIPGKRPPRDNVHMYDKEKEGELYKRRCFYAAKPRRPL